ncbi:MAG TPA: T9SS type A sorting domain-containing protein [Cryomorphaceae bacterium]|nr:T9SS type A sorting domain-containing protein [Cryomorphaceae bacterium]
MKKNFLLATIISLSLQLNGQNEPELIGIVDGANITTQMRYISHGVPKIIVQDLDEVDIYNLDLTLYTSFSLPDIDVNTGALFITTSLFDCDSTQLEYMVSGGTSDSTFTRIYREDGNLFLDIPGYGYFSSTNLTGLEVTIASDDDGSYAMFNSGFGTNEVVLYRFCGQVPQPLARESDGTILSGIMEQQNNNGFDAYPNPARETIKFEYDLQGHKKANLQLFNTSGQLMKELMLGQAFDFIRLNISDLEQGTYIARITTDDGFELSEKFVKVD